MLKKSLLAITAAALFLPLAPFAEARIAYPDRNDVGEIESATITLQAQINLFQKYVLNGLDNLKSITNLGNLIENTDILKQAENGVRWIKNSVDIDNQVGKAINDIDSLFSDAGSEAKSGFQSMWDSIFGSSESVAGDTVGDIVNSGGGGSDGVELAGNKGTLTEIRQKDGLAKTALTATFRTSQAAKVLAEKAAQSMGEQDKAIAQSAGYLYSILPMLKPELLAVHTGDISSVIAQYSPQDVDAYFVFLSDAVMSAPVGEIGTLLDKYFNKESAYSDEKLLAAQKEQIANLDEYPNKSGYLNGASSITAATGAMGNLVKEQAVALNQWEAITELCADSVKLDALRTSMQSASMSLALKDYTEAVLNVAADKNARKIIDE